MTAYWIKSGAYANRNRIALDESVRRFDHDGRLHVEMTNISKANVCPYYGREIPNSEEMGLEPDKVYKLLRDPSELKKARFTSNNIPLLSTHIVVTPEEPSKEVVVGSTGTDARFDDPYLRNSLVIWDADAIEDLLNREVEQLSCAYHYDADMTPGEFLGEAYDGVMRNLRFNHVALVREGRAGKDVVVGDSLPISLRLPPNMETTMAKAAAAARLSGMALIARGALAAYLKPRLAADAQIDLKKIVLGTTYHNWDTAKPVIADRVRKATKGKLAEDADLKDMEGMLEELDGEKKEGEDTELEPTIDPEDTNRAIDEAMVESKSKEEEKERREAEDARRRAHDAKAADASEEEAEQENKLREAEDKRRGAWDKKYGKDWMEDDDDSNEGNQPNDPGMDKNKRGMDKKAMDTAIRRGVKAALDEALGGAVKAAVATTRQTMRAVAEAERFVHPWIGELAIPQDTPEDVYRLALDSLGVDIKGVHPSAYRHILDAQPRPGDRSGASGHRRVGSRPAMDENSKGFISSLGNDYNRLKGAV